MVVIVGAIHDEIIRDIQSKVDLEVRFLFDSDDVFKKLLNVEKNNNATIVISPEGRVIFSAYGLTDYRILSKIIGGKVS